MFDAPGPRRVARVGRPNKTPSHPFGNDRLEMPVNHENRITALESIVRRQRLALVAGGLLLGGTMILGMGQDAPKELTLEGLTITKDGQPRVLIGTNAKDGSVGIAFLDSKEKPRLTVGTGANDDAGILVMDANQSPKIMMGTGPQGSGISLIGATLTEIAVQGAKDAN